MGSWIHSFAGNVRFHSAPTSTEMVHVYENFPPGTWRLYRSLLPGTEITAHRSHGPLKFEAVAGALVSVNPGPREIDLRFETAHVTISLS